VLNRIQIETLVEAISPDMLLENTESYLLYKNITGAINGIWFFDKKTKDDFYNTITQLMHKLKENPDTDPKVEIAESDESEDRNEGEEDSGSAQVDLAEQKKVKDGQLMDPELQHLTKNLWKDLFGLPKASTNEQQPQQVLPLSHPKVQLHGPVHILSRMSQQPSQIPSQALPQPQSHVHTKSQQDPQARPLHLPVSDRTEQLGSASLGMHTNPHSRSTGSPSPIVSYPFPSVPLSNFFPMQHPPQNGRIPHHISPAHNPNSGKPPVVRNIMLNAANLEDDTNGNTNHSNILSKQQFQTALTRLVQNESFIELVYSEYLKSLSFNDAES